MKVSKQFLHFAKIFKLSHFAFCKKLKTIFASFTKSNDSFAYLLRKTAQFLPPAKQNFERDSAHALKNYIDLCVENCLSWNEINFDKILIAIIQLSIEKLFGKS